MSPISDKMGSIISRVRLRPSDGARESVRSHSLNREDSSKRRGPRFNILSILQEWIWEFASAGLSLTCLVAIVIFLFVFQDKPLSRWNVRLDITPNTLVSFLSTLSRASLLLPIASSISQLKWIHAASAPNYLSDIEVFDAASRGPWGALTLLWTLNARTKLATWGSIITVLTMAMDPFTQQLLSYPTRNVYAEGATFPAADRYDANNYKGGLEDTDLLLDQGVQGAVLSGIFNLDFPVQLGCVSGTCTWPRFVTLGVTSSCKNVTNGTKVSGYDNIYDYTSPSGIHMTTTFLHNSSSQIDHLRNLSSPTDSIMKVAIANIKSPFSRSHPDVSECEVKWCAKIFNNVTVTNGTLSAGHVREIPLRFAELNTTDEKHPVVRFKAITDELQLASRTFEINTTDWLLTVAFLASLFSSIATDNINSNVQTVIDVSPNVAEMLANISTSMTYAIGNNPSGSKVAGKVIIQEQFIRVSWYWIILPVAEILMGLAFLGATILYTQRKGVTIWKSSPVFPFFTRLEGWEDSSLSVASLKEIETRSGKMWGILRPGDGGTVSFSRSDV